MPPRCGVLTRLSKSIILRWARASRRRTRQWPTHLSGPIPESPGDNWEAIRYALREGRRGLPGGSSLARLLAEHRGVPLVNPFAPRIRLSNAQILDWAPRRTSSRTSRSSAHCRIRNRSGSKRPDLDRRRSIAPHRISRPAGRARRYESSSESSPEPSETFTAFR